MRALLRPIALLLLAAVTPALAASPTEDRLAKEGFRKLSVAQIRHAFVGKRFSDDVHFTDSYKANGAIEGISLAKKVTKTWVISKDQLCITSSFGETCYAVWKKGAAVRLVFGESDLTLDGDLR